MSIDLMDTIFKRSLTETHDFKKETFIHEAITKHSGHFLIPQVHVYWNVHVHVN